MLPYGDAYSPDGRCVVHCKFVCLLAFALVAVWYQPDAFRVTVKASALLGNESVYSFVRVLRFR